MRAEGRRGVGTGTGTGMGIAMGSGEGALTLAGGETTCGKSCSTFT